MLFKPARSYAQPRVIDGNQPVRRRPGSPRTEPGEQIQQACAPTRTLSSPPHVLAQSIGQVFARKTPLQRIEVKHGRKPSFRKPEVKGMEVTVNDLQLPRSVGSFRWWNRQQPVQEARGQRMPSRKVPDEPILAVWIVLFDPRINTCHVLESLREPDGPVNKRIGFGIREVTHFDFPTVLPLQAQGAAIGEIR